jgi:hypothetical protein
MRSLTCQGCGQTHRMNETFDIQGRTFCAICCEEFLREQGHLAPVQVARQVDPTICAICGADNGDVPLRLYHHQPLCAACANPPKQSPRHPERGNAPVAAIVAIVVFVVMILAVIVFLR